MPSFSKRSRNNLDTCHNDIIAVCNELILITDFTVLRGYAKPEEQFELYKKGREYRNDKWIVVYENNIVTYCDGFKKLSRHNESPSSAIDIVPYPINWKNINRFYFLAGSFLAIAYRLRVQGIIESGFEWGGHWKTFKDYPHLQIKKTKRKV